MSPALAAFAQFLGTVLGEVLARIDWAVLIPAVVQAAQNASTTTAANVPALPEEAAVQKEVEDAIRNGQAPAPGVH